MTAAATISALTSDLIYDGPDGTLRGARVLAMASCRCAMCLHYRDNLGWQVTRVEVELELGGVRRAFKHARPRWFVGASEK